MSDMVIPDEKDKTSELRNHFPVSSSSALGLKPSDPKIDRDHPRLMGSLCV
jgi:hypothetical protein